MPKKRVIFSADHLIGLCWLISHSWIQRASKPNTWPRQSNIEVLTEIGGGKKLEVALQS